MLTGIGLRNFKAFGDEMQEAPLSKITLIYGPNSGGKSSIIQALLLLKQSLKVEYGKNRELVTRGDFADLGSSQAMLHKHDEERELEINLQYQKDILEHSIQNIVSMVFTSIEGACEMSSIRFKITLKDGSASLVEANCEITSNTSLLLQWRLQIIGVDESRPIYLTSQRFLPFLVVRELVMARALQLHPDLKLLTPITMNFHFDSTRALERLQVTQKDQRLSEALFQLAERELNLIESSIVQDEESRTWEEEHIIWKEITSDPAYLEMQQKHGLAIDESKRELEDANRLTLALAQELINLQLSEKDVLSITPEDISDYYEHQLRSINYLGPLRSAPERLYRLSSEINSYSGITGITGEFSANALRRDTCLEERVNQWFAQFGIPYKLNVIPLGKALLSGEYITIALCDKRTNTQVTLADVGYGINQLLPVIIEGIASQEDSIICVEQPEIHLHPRLQADIADLMIDTIADEPGKRKQWIVETHSELLILRLQRRIREGKIKPEDISVLYVDPDDKNTEGSAIISLRMDENGDFIDHWPEGFFDEAFNELTAEPDDPSRLAANPTKNGGTTASIQSEEPLVE